MTEPDTRARIQQTALRLFTEQGYEATSLREIALQLGVTKAALYYHFRTKDDIIASLMEDRIEAMDALLRWARRQPRNAATRAEILRRFAAQLRESRPPAVMRFMERNQTALRGHPQIAGLRKKMLLLSRLFYSAGDPPEVRLRRSMALVTLHAATLTLRNGRLSEARLQQAALRVALQLADALTGVDTPAVTGH